MPQRPVRTPSRPNSTRGTGRSGNPANTNTLKPMNLQVKNISLISPMGGGANLVTVPQEMAPRVKNKFQK